VRSRRDFFAAALSPVVAWILPPPKIIRFEIVGGKPSVSVVDRLGMLENCQATGGWATDIDGVWVVFEVD